MLSLLHTYAGIDLITPLVDILASYIINPIKFYIGSEYLYVEKQQLNMIKKTLLLTESVFIDSLYYPDSQDLNVLFRYRDCYEAFYHRFFSDKMSFIEFYQKIRSFEREPTLRVGQQSGDLLRSGLFNTSSITPRSDLGSTVNLGRYKDSNRTVYHRGLHSLVDFTSNTGEIYRSSLFNLSKQTFDNVYRLDALSSKVRGLLWLVKFHEEWPSLGKDFLNYKNNRS